MFCGFPLGLLPLITAGEIRGELGMGNGDIYSTGVRLLGRPLDECYQVCLSFRGKRASYTGRHNGTLLPGNAETIQSTKEPPMSTRSARTVTFGAKSPELLESLDWMG
ncbi:hypothetical protein B0H14DRAFT_2837834 [Mycena olivaceomarginata]|nr:hypothetical protein B0H14DRAFT_2837834 [Mycena olivaceomarginata]